MGTWPMACSCANPRDATCLAGCIYAFTSHSLGFSNRRLDLPDYTNEKNKKNLNTYIPGGGLLTAIGRSDPNVAFG